VICNRATPIQKAKLVRLMRETTEQITVAVGDGANDVSMLHEANVGIGIFGKEGTQAARAADFSLRTFRHIGRLLCVHGRYSMVRNALLIQYAFYKNAAVFMVLVWFAFYSGFSAQTIYDEWIMALFNIVLTSLPPIAIGVFEKDISEKAIFKHPQAYSRVQNNTVFTPATLSFWFLSAIYHSLVIFFGTYLLWESSVLGQDGLTFGFWEMGNAMLMIGMLVITFKLVLHVNTWNWIIHFCVWGSLVIYLTLSVVWNIALFAFPAQFFVFFMLLQQPRIYLWVVIGTCMCLLPDLLILYTKRIFFPEEWQILQEVHTTKIRQPRDTTKTYGVFVDREHPLPLSVS